MSIEAMKRALAWLDRESFEGFDAWAREGKLIRETLSTAIEQAEKQEPAQQPTYLVQHMVNRFLGWKLPEDFAPDCGISFQRESDYEHPDFGRTKFDPTGTNLFHAGQAKAMFEHCLQGYTTPPAAQRQWVDMPELALLGAYEEEQQGRFGDHARGLLNVQAKLREKNGGQA